MYLFFFKYKFYVYQVIVASTVYKIPAKKKRKRERVGHARPIEIHTCDASSL